MVWGRYALPGRGKQKKSSSTNSSRTTASAVVPPWFAQPLAGPALEGANTPRRDDGRTRRSLTDRVRSVRNSETIFPGTFRAPFHQKGLSVAYLPGYSSLHRLWVCLFSLRYTKSRPLSRAFPAKNPGTGWKAHRQVSAREIRRKPSHHPIRLAYCWMATGTAMIFIASAIRRAAGAVEIMASRKAGSAAQGLLKFFRGGYQVVRERRRKTIKSNPITRANARASRARTLGLMAPKTRSSKG